jgi:hypothetical protein
MYNGFGKKPKFAIAASMLMAAILLGTTAISSITTAESVYAYRNNQAASQANDCGNGSVPIDTVLCQNTGSQIQGDKNTAALSSQQTFPADPCVACFDSLTSEQRTHFEEVLDEFTGGSITTIEQLCEAFAELSPQDRGRIVDLLISVLGFETASEIILCLEEVFGLAPPPRP